MKKLIAITISLLMLYAIAGCKSKPGTREKPEVTSQVSYSKITIRKDATHNGIFDPSVEYGNDSIGWLAYSRVTLPDRVDTRIAKSTDRGRNWQYVMTVNPSHTGHQRIGTQTITGSWRYETPTLVYDASDKAARRWKLFYQRYLTKPPHGKGNSLFQHGWIEMKTAAAPSGPWSEAIPVLGKPGSRSKTNPNDLHTSLAKMKFYNELGSIVVDDVIYLSMDASATDNGLGQWNKRNIILLGSKDHAKSWFYAGTLTDYEDASNAGYLAFTGSSLVKEGERLYMLLTPSGKKGLFTKKGHDGTYVIAIDNIKQAKLNRNHKGKLIVSKNLAVEKHMHSGGLSDYHEKNTRGGILFGQLSNKKKHAPEFFRVFSTGERVQ